MDPAKAIELERMEHYSMVNETIARGDSAVQEFYDGAVVFITGGSGFLGKQLIEKLFRSCRIQKIYILMRSKHQKSLNDRLKDMCEDQLYEYLHKTQPDFVSKLIPVEGDITKTRIGLTEKNWNILIEEVNIIFHGAATIKFAEPLKVAIMTNLHGTREMLTLAKSCKKLKSFVHVSTAFAYATADHVGQPVLEQFYDCTVTPNLAIDLVRQLDEDILNAITPQLLKNWPNTYTYTKALAEELVRTTADDLPICIVRPSFVAPAYREPPGWADKSTMNGPVGFIIGVCLGGLHVMYCNSKNIFDAVPVDLVNNAVLVAAYETAEQRKRGEPDIKIYTVSNRRNLVHVDTFYNFMTNEARSLATPKVLWHGYVILTASKFLFFLLTWLLHFIPGYLVDFILKLTGRKPKVIKLFNKAYTQNEIFSYFTFNYWKFGDSNLLQLHKSLSPEDRFIFNCDICDVDMYLYMNTAVVGIRKYILNDGLQNTDFAIKKVFWLRILNAIYLTVYAYVLWKCFYIFFKIMLFIVRLVLRV